MRAQGGGRVRAPPHNCAGGNKQTRLSPVHTVTLADFAFDVIRYDEGFAKLHVAEPRRNFDLMGSENVYSHSRSSGGNLSSKYHLNGDVSSFFSGNDR